MSVRESSGFSRKHGRRPNRGGCRRLRLAKSTHAECWVRSRERALSGLDPGGVGVGELEGHDTTLPARRDGLGDARAERGRVDEAVGRVGRAAGLANHELVDVEAVLGDLEQRGPREGRAGRRDQTRAVEVEALVVELDVVLWEGRVSWMGGLGR